MAKLLGKVALITGGNSGIGRAIAMRFAQEGAAVAIAARRVEKTRYVVAEIESQRGKAMGLAMDVTAAHQVEEGLAELLRRFMHLDVLVNAAGIFHHGPVSEATEQEWDQVLDTNLKGAFLCSRAAMRQMMTQGNGGCILNIASQAGLDAWAGTGLYSASKFGMVGLGKAMGAEGAAEGIRVSTLCPGKVDTSMVPDADSPDRRALLRPEDVADAALYLATLGANALVTTLAIERKGALDD